MSQFTDAIKFNWPYHIIAPGEWEGSFSWSACGSCGSSLGGYRFEAHAFEPTPNSVVYDIKICVDCLMFHANGDEPEELPKEHKV